MKVRPYERPLDALDGVAQGATVDMHDDAALHNRDLDGGAHPGIMSAVWEGGVNVAGVFAPNIRNFHRHVTRDTLDHAGKGVQIFSQVTMGFPVVPEVSIDAYTGVVASWPEQARATALTRWIWQAAWTYGQVEENSERLVLATTARQTVNAINSGKIAAQLGIEGAFPFEADARDVDAVKKLFAEVKMPASFPKPTELELSSRLGLLTYARRIGTQYIGLSHLVSSCMAGGGPWPSKGERLSAEGRGMVLEMNRLGIMLDLAHASQAAQADVIEMVNKGEYDMPLIVSHGLLPVHGDEPGWRVTSPKALEAVKKTGGIVGIIGAKAHLHSGQGFGKWFCNVMDWLFVWPLRLLGLGWHFPGATNAMAFIDDIVDQMDYIRDRIDIDHIGLGLDGDGFVGLPYKNYAQMQDAIKTRMKARGYSDADITKVFAGNYLHVLQRRDAMLEAKYKQKNYFEGAPAQPTL